MNTLDIVREAEPDTCSDSTRLGDVIEPLIGAENPSENVVEGATRPPEI